MIIFNYIIYFNSKQANFKTAQINGIEIFLNQIVMQTTYNKSVIIKELETAILTGQNKIIIQDVEFILKPLQNVTTKKKEAEANAQAQRLFKTLINQLERQIKFCQIKINN